jgi:hypothetical protein
MFTIYPTRLILAPQPERAACPAVEPPRARGFFLPVAFGPPVCWLVRLPSLIAWQLTVQPCEVICTTSGALCWWTPGERRLAPRPDRIGCGDFFAKMDDPADG